MNILKSLFFVFLFVYGIYALIKLQFLPKLSPNTIQSLYESSIDAFSQINNQTEKKIQQSRLKPASNSYLDAVIPHGPKSNDIKLENATILVLCRNWELTGILQSMRSLEDRFNKDYHYPWTFLNDVPFDNEFIELTSLMASGPTAYGLIPSEDWNTPNFINQTKYNECVEDFAQQGILYGGSKSYRNMCHFNSGFFFRQELVMKYDYYFRVEPDVEYFCDFQMDPFRLMREQNKKYGFVMTISEYPETIPTLWENVEGFLNKYPQHMNTDNSIEFITSKESIGTDRYLDDTSPYNMCHFWSNFEIGDLNFFRSQKYMDYFNYLSNAGGFFYERWGDAPVHSIGASILLSKDEMFHFEDIGYFHSPFVTCPTSYWEKYGKRCICPSDKESINITPNSCLPRWWKHGSGKRFIREYFHEEDYL